MLPSPARCSPSAPLPALLPASTTCSVGGHVLHVAPGALQTVDDHGDGDGGQRPAAGIMA
ncbi:MAG: hypothetical protein H6646_00360 [Anaerolineales bacterium]|nr:hypothetical protein [Anaerolineales bacterium]